jgi:hypothetical protein
MSVDPWPEAILGELDALEAELLVEGHGLL